MSSEWREVELKEVADIDTGFPFKSAKYTTEGDLRVVRGKNVTEGHCRWGSDAKYWNLYEESLEKYLLRKNDIVIGMDGSKIGKNKALITSQDLPSILAQRVGRVRAKEGNSQGFIWQVINSKHFFHYIDLVKTGTSIPHMSLGQIGSFRLKLPPLQEQKNIAHILGTLDDKIELNRKMNETLEQMAQALFTSWFVDFDPVLDNALAAGNDIPEELQRKAEKRQRVLECGKYKKLSKAIMDLFPASFEFSDELGKWVPVGWEVKSFGDFYDCFDNKRIPLSKKQREEKKPGIYPYYGATSINDYIDEYIFDDTFLLLGEDGSVMKEDGTPYTQYVWGKIWVNNHAHVLKGKNGVTTEHLLTFIRRENINAFVTGAVQLKINQGNMKRIPFLFASESINGAFGDQLKVFYDRYKANMNQIESLVKQRDVLLPQLISGKLRVINYKTN